MVCRANSASCLLKIGCRYLLLLSLILGATSLFAVEHPGTLHSDDNCSSCHAAKTAGKFVHAAMAISCTTCHLAQTQGDMTTLTFLISKEKVCSACHENSPAVHAKTPVTKRICTDCHDSHSSNRRLLLSDLSDTKTNER